ncbi:tyrosine-protein kinase Src42A isoform X1 [Procambarus clarkii]|uniref:tyrosine-protein kinase Src42A isoform X1 n=1 Tax=Procambarus clarkii TaxID=6728 RepID=UPI0037427CDE
MLKKIKNIRKSKGVTSSDILSPVPPAPEVYEALYSYKATREGDLSINEGDVLEILAEEGDGWWMAANTRTGTTGYVPSNFIKKYLAENSASPGGETYAQPLPAITPVAKPDKYIVLYDFEAIDTDGITVRRSEVLELLHQPDSHWSYVKVTRGRTATEGYVPTNYIVKVEDYSDQPWYFGKLSREETQALLLKPLNASGAFLIRNSESDVGFSLSVLFSGLVKHYRVREEASMGKRIYFISTDKSFGSLKELVEYYQENTGLCLRLTHPCKRGGPEGPVTPGNITLQTKPTVTVTEGTKTKGTSLPDSTTKDVAEEGKSVQNEWEIDRTTIQMHKKLGSGQFGDVFLGRWNNETDVAVKTMKSDCMELEEFVREAEVMQKLRHPKLVKLYGLCTTPRDQPLLIVAELVKNGALLQHLRNRKQERRPHPSRELIMMGVQVASGMAYLEAEKFIHRDLAARNVLVGDGINVKIADFGLARVIKDDIYQHNSQRKIPYKWTAPEAISHGHFTSKSDVWSYGILLFEIVTHGQMPYEEMDNKTTVTMINKGYRLPKPPSCPQALYEIMFKCWLDKPELRLNFAELKKEMEKLSKKKLT